MAAKKTKKSARKASPKAKAKASPKASTKPAAERDPRLPAAGSTIERTWHDKKYSVVCGAADFEYDGKPFSSLTAVAKEITGAKAINGFFWFGLAPRAVARAEMKPVEKKGKKPAAPKVGNGNDIGTAEGQRAALAEISKPKKSPRRKVEKITEAADEIREQQHSDAIDQAE